MKVLMFIFPYPPYDIRLNALKIFYDQEINWASSGLGYTLVLFSRRKLCLPNVATERNEFYFAITLCLLIQPTRSGYPSRLLIY